MEFLGSDSFHNEELVKGDTSGGESKIFKETPVSGGDDLYDFMKANFGDAKAANALPPNKRQFFPSRLLGDGRRLFVQTDLHLHVVDRHNLVVGRHVELRVRSRSDHQVNKHVIGLGHEAAIHEVGAVHFDDGIGEKITHERSKKITRMARFVFAVGLADDFVSRGGQRAIRMQLVADAAFCSVGEHRSAFVAEGVGVVVAAEFTPRGVEFPRHAEEVKGQVAGVFRRHRAAVVTPAADRESLEFQVT